MSRTTETLQFVRHSASLFTKARESLIMMLEPFLEVIVENVITDQTTLSRVNAHSNMVLCAFLNLYTSALPR